MMFEIELEIVQIGTVYVEAETEDQALDLIDLIEVEVDIDCPKGVNSEDFYDFPADVKIFTIEPHEHVWDGPRIALNQNASVATCSRCGASAAPELTNPQRPGTPGQDETASVPEPKRDGTEGETGKE